MNTAQKLKQEIGSATAWNIPTSYAVLIARKAANRYGVNYLFKDGSKAFIPKGTAQLVVDDGRPELPVIFRMEGNTKEAVRPGHGTFTPVAFFPTLPGNRDPLSCTVYAHAGQHGTSAVSYYASTRPASPKQYADLLSELRSIYEREGDPDAVRLVVKQAWSRRFDVARRQALKGS